MRRLPILPALVSLVLSSIAIAAEAPPPDLILHHAKVLTVDRNFSIHQAIAITGAKITAVGDNDPILATRGPNTTVIDLAGKTLLPGLIDSHTHASNAAVTEFDHAIPDMDSIADVLKYIRDRAATLEQGQWIRVRQVFITRLTEQRYPTRAELDAAAPWNPVIFATGPDASLNTFALKLSGIDKNFKPTDNGPGFVELDPATGEPTGILRSCTRFVKFVDPCRQPTPEQWRDRMVQLFQDYNAVGITSIAERDADPASLARHEALRKENRLTLRVSVSYNVNTNGELDSILEKIRTLARHPLRADDPLLKIVGIKVYLDGGMLTGSAYMRQPWGVSKIYSITDPQYRGLLFIPPQRLVPIVRTAVENNLQFTAHSVGDGAVHAFLDACEEVNKTAPVRPTRPCIAHANFQSAEAPKMMARLGVVADLQPAWLYIDTRTLVQHFGDDRLRYFQPLRSCFDAGAIVGGGSDHMQKIGSLRSNNPYDPFLGMWTALTRRARWHDAPLHPEEALSREQVIRFYTSNNAYILFREHQVGSLEPGKLADLIVVDRDLLTCPVDDLRQTRVLQTYLGGKRVFSRP